MLSAAAGCQPGARPSPPRPTIPAAADVASVHLKSIGSSLGDPYEVTLTKQADIAALIRWLEGVDWTSSKAHDLSNVGLAEVGEITVTKKDGARQAFGLSGGVIIVNRWEWPADTLKLAELAKGAGAKAP
jgi:hypothetical protein